ncbi:MAG TPA: RsmE family RNA methyltransferase [Candidatus Megaira endosymbiont of Stentor roeselii]|nr:RsmE family RNA methyltransferase [Candidatus Megaera endosymbiont of Stentor roeselii]
MKFSSLSRIYTTSRIAKNQIITLSDDIFHYCKSVLRMKISEEFRLFNSIDGEFKAEIRAINKRDLQVFIGQKLREVEHQNPLILAMCIIKPDRFTEALKAVVQQGVTEIIPLISERTQFKSINQQRLTKCIIESVEQSEGFVIPVLRLPVNLKEFCNINGVDQIIFANEEESGGVKINSIKKFEENIAILVGPEGGFSPSEKEKLISNPKIISVSLGNRVLRSEVAAINMVACVNLMRE